jgi:hypothetical protein
VRAAREAQRRHGDLLDGVQGMERLALGCLERGDRERAREILRVRLSQLRNISGVTAPEMFLNPIQTGYVAAHTIGVPTQFVD